MNVYMYVFLSRCRRLSRRLALIKSYKKKFISKSRDYLSRPRKSYKNNDMQKIYKIQSRLYLSCHITRYRYMRCALLRGGIMFWWILYDLLSRYGTWYTYNMARWATIMLHFFRGGGIRNHFWVLISSSRLLDWLISWGRKPCLHIDILIFFLMEKLCISTWNLNLINHVHFWGFHS